MSELQERAFSLSYNLYTVHTSHFMAFISQQSMSCDSDFILKTSLYTGYELSSQNPKK